jgi:hypothetical protein
MTKLQKITLAVSTAVTIFGGLAVPAQASARAEPCADGDYIFCFQSIFQCPSDPVWQSCTALLMANWGCSPNAMDLEWSGCYAFPGNPCNELELPGYRCRVWAYR